MSRPAPARKRFIKLAIRLTAGVVVVLNQPLKRSRTRATPLRRTPVATLLLALLALPAWAAPRLTLDASLVWTDPDPRFGGLSGLAVTDTGRHLLAIGDRGIWVTAELERDWKGRLTGITRTGLGPLHGVKGEALDGQTADAEGLALDPQGRAYISFERMQRVRRYAPIDGPATSLPGNPAFRKLGENTGLEALALDADGTLHAIPERRPDPGPWIPVYRLRDGKWIAPLRLPYGGDEFLESDATFGPDGRLYLLERKFRWLGGFATRIRSFGRTEQGFDAGETLLVSRFGELDNMEGISAWRDPEGRIRLTLISDDNFFPLQRTQLNEYILTDDAASG